jgi:hypothetical protein
MKLLEWRGFKWENIPGSSYSEIVLTTETTIQMTVDFRSGNWNWSVEVVAGGCVVGGYDSTDELVIPIASGRAKTSRKAKELCEKHVLQPLLSSGVVAEVPRVDIQDGAIKWHFEEHERPRNPLRCYDCGLPYSSTAWMDAVVPNDIWGRIAPTPHGGGVLCISCMARRLEKLGLRDVPLQIKSGPFLLNYEAPE